MLLSPAPSPARPTALRRSRLPAWLTAASCFALLGAGCGPDREGDTPVGDSTQAVIYGADDRKDYFEEADEAFRQLLRRSTAILVTPDTIDESDPASVQLLGSTMQDSFSVCPTERFYDQPVVGQCSGTLIAEDLMLTAGHCITSASDCRQARWVFNFYYESDGQLATITSEDVYRCTAIVAQKLLDTRTTSFDYAIVRLDRPATPRHTPAPISPVRTFLANSDPLVMVGFPLGLPAKVARGKVSDPRLDVGDFFGLLIDSYEGNSGSAVYDTQGRIVGIDVRGANDFRQSGSCYVSDVLPDNGSRGEEEASYAFTAVEAFCLTPSSAGSVLCGDGGAASPDGGPPDGGVIAPDGGRSASDGGPSTVADGGTLTDADGGTASLGGKSGGCQTSEGDAAPTGVLLAGLVALALRPRRRQA